MNLSTIPTTALKLAGKAAELGARGAQEVIQRAGSLRGRGDDDDARFAPTSPPVPTPVKSETVQSAAEQVEKAEAKTDAAPKTPAPAAKSNGAKKPKARVARSTIANPKKARAVRQRERDGVTGGSDSGIVEGATGHGGTPATVDAENTPKDLAAKGEGKAPAPMGSTDKS